MKNISNPTQVTYTEPANGPDPVEVEKYEYDSDGGLVKKSYDLNGDGNFEEIYEYDTNGNLIRSSEDTDSDGELDSITTYEYSARGARVKESVDSDADGTADSTSGSPDTVVPTEETASNGNSVLSYDNDGDSVVDEVYEFDAKNNLVKVSSNFDSGRAGTIKEYATNGELVREVFDNDNDGNADESREYNSVNGELVKELYDYNSDGTIDGFTTYDIYGNRTLESYDKDADGNVDFLQEYNASGSVVKITNDNDRNGKIDFVEEFKYGGEITKRSYYDTDGKLTRVEEFNVRGDLLQESVDGNGDGEFSETEIVKYQIAGQVDEFDDNGNLVKSSFHSVLPRLGTNGALQEVFEFNAKGNITKHTEYNSGRSGNTINRDREYNSDGQLTKVTEDVNGGGSLAVTYTAEFNSSGTLTKEYDARNYHNNNGDPITLREYDGNGNLLQESKDFGGDGTYDVVTTSTYSSSMSAGEQQSTLSIGSVGSAQSLHLNFEDFGLDGIGELAVFSLEADGSKTLLDSFFALEEGKVSSDHNKGFSLDTSSLLPGTHLQFELVENGEVRMGTVMIQEDGSAVLDFGDSNVVSVAFKEDMAPNLLREDATTLDLTGFDGDVTLNFSVYREASFDSTVGFYSTDTADGGIITDPMTGAMLMPGDDGYKDAALSRQLDVQLTGENGEMTSFSSTLAGGDFLGMFLVSDGSDASSGDVLFSAMGMNSGTDHVKMLGNNTFGFEDMVGGGDQDFNDMVVNVEVA